MLNRARLLGVSPAHCLRQWLRGGDGRPLLAAVNVRPRLLKGTNGHLALWGTYGGSYNEQRFSPLKKINDANVKDLGLAWYADYDTNQNQHGSPLYVGWRDLRVHRAQRGACLRCAGRQAAVDLHAADGAEPATSAW